MASTVPPRRARMAGLGRIIALGIVVAACAGCAGDGYTPKRFTATDRCKGCEAGGLFSGEDGTFTHEFGL